MAEVLVINSVQGKSRNSNLTFPPPLTPRFFCNLLVHKYLQQTFTGHQLYAGAAPGLVFKAPGQGVSSLFLARFPCLPGAKALPGHAEQRSFLPLSYLRSPASRAMRRPKTFSLVSVALEFQDVYVFVERNLKIQRPRRHQLAFKSDLWPHIPTLPLCLCNLDQVTYFPEPKCSYLKRVRNNPHPDFIKSKAAERVVFPSSFRFIYRLH